MFFHAQFLTLNFNQFLEAFPFLILAVSFALSVLAAGLKLNPRFFKILGVFGFGLAAFFWSLAILKEPLAFMGLVATPVSRGVGLVISLFAILTFSFFDIADRYSKRPEWLALFFLSTLGFTLLPTARDFISFFVFLEAFSIPAYVLVAYDVQRERSLESSLKYMLSGAFSSALLLMGIALLYLVSGTVDYVGLSSHFDGNLLGNIGALLVLGGILFKLTVAPFHFWAPDVYQGAPTGVAAFLAASTKLSVFTAAGIAMNESSLSLNGDLIKAGVFVAMLSAIAGSVLAYTQRSFRRMLAYSGTVNAGVLVPLLVAGQSGLSSGFFFLVTYGLTLILALSSFAQLMKKRNVDINDDLDVDSFSAADSKIAPAQTLLLASALISMAGIPPYPGFIAKYWAYSDLWRLGHKDLVVVALVATLMGVAYYIRVAGKFFFLDKKRAVSTR